MALAQLVLGSALGARFSGTPVALIGRTLLLAPAPTATMLLIIWPSAALSQPSRGIRCLRSCLPSSRVASPR